jgi:cytochrome c biogenesis protein
MQETSPIPVTVVKARPKADGLSEQILRALGSYKLTLSLFVVLGLFAAFGSFIPQGDDAPRIAELYGDKALYYARMLGFDDVYRSAWFILVLALMALNLILVTWLRVPHVWKIARATDATLLKDPLVPKTAFQATWDCTLSPLEALEAARGALQGEFPRLVFQEGPAKRVLIGERHRLSLWAAHIVHLGLLLLLFAGALKVLAGSNRYFMIKEGDTAQVWRDTVRFGLWMEPLQLPGLSFGIPLPRLYERVKVEENFKLTLDKFDVEYYEGSTAPKLFRSDVKIMRGDQIERSASIEVNDPLNVDGTLLYQSSWGYDGLYFAHFELALPGEKDHLEVVAPYRQRLALLNTGWELEVDDFYPDATMAGPGKLVNQSGDLKNPAIRVKFFQHGKERAHTWFVYAVPDIQMTKIKGLELRGSTVDPIPYTVLQANHDAGIPFAMAGAMLVVFGTFSAFYLFYRKAWVLVEPLPDGGSRVQLAGFVRRNKIVFKRVFERLQGRLAERLGQAAPAFDDAGSQGPALNAPLS